jgi:7,8-dihydropterin-6-yl-methyl-4-(beta-D-ribofuranosyl)aminobenzene 5'-phosphate synthase
MALKEVENTEITCLVDNNVDMLLPSTEVARRPSIAKNWYDRPLVAEHGFCAALTLQARGARRRLLLDSGLDPMAASHNADVLGFDLSNCESLISSHGHIDHAGGLLNIRKKMDQKQKIPLVLHGDAFRNRLVKFPDGRTIDLPAPSRTLLAEAGYEIIEKNSTSLLIDDTVLVTGEIPRTNNFEKGFPSHYSEADDGGMEADPLIKDDQAIILNVKDRGLVVITGCGHAGIINTLNYAKELKPAFVVPCHCSGLKAVSEIARRMPRSFVQNSVGTSYVF